MALSDSSYCDVLYRVAGVFKLFFMDIQSSGTPIHIDNRIIAAVLMFIFVLINYRGVKVSGRWQNAFVFFFWSVSAVWMLIMIHNIDFSNYLPETLATFPGFKAWMEILTWIWLVLCRV